MNTIQILVLLGAGILGLLIGYFYRKYQARKSVENVEQKAQKLLSDANHKSKEVLFEAKNEALKIIDDYKQEEEKKRSHLDKMEAKLFEKEDGLQKRIQQLDDSKLDLETKIESVKNLKEETEKLKEMEKIELERVASLSKEEAKKLLIKEVEEASREALAEQIHRYEIQLKKDATDKAKFMIADAIQRYAAEVSTESTITVVALPSDEMKGRIIGKEGRNVSAFEQATGVDVIIDDTPGSIVLSGFDLVRRYIAKISLEKLMIDGRIHPARIEEVVEKTKEDVAQMIKELGEKAVFEAGVAGLNVNLIKLLGRLKFRVSHGQNVLKHCMEVSFLAVNLASELGADQNICKEAGLLHDIGKAVDHEIPGHHAVVGRDILKKFDLSEEVIHAVESHEGEIEPKTLEAMIVSAANAICAARPGATRENLDNFIKRLEELENTTNAFEGVQSSFAVQTGHEVRIFVKPEIIDDYAMVKLSHDITKKIEKDLQFSGQIKINMIRETKAEDVAK